MSKVIADILLNEILTVAFQQESTVLGKCHQHPKIGFNRHKQAHKTLHSLLTDKDSLGHVTQGPVEREIKYGVRWFRLYLEP